MTYRELRKVLYQVEDQTMSVRDLNDILYKIENQNEKINGWDMAEYTLNIPKTKQEAI